nr:RecName: Full=Nucleus-vacuole junction protein 2 [Schizosaccharomyces pombe 972h-]
MFFAFLITYLLGGVTFLPFILFIYLLTRPTHKSEELRIIEPNNDCLTKLDKDIRIQGWIRVTTKFLQGKSGSVKVQEIPQDQLPKSSSDNAVTDRKTISPSGINNQYVIRNPKDVYYATVQAGKLHLFDPVKTSELLHVINLHEYLVVFYPGTVTENELFSNRNAIFLKYPAVSHKKESSTKSLLNKDLYVYGRTPSNKEDWYYALLSYSKISPAIKPLEAPIDFDYASVHHNLTALSSPDTDWLNAFIGRIFLGIHKTEGFKSLVVEKLTKKLSRIKTPGIMTDVKVIDVDVGEAIPTVNGLKFESLSNGGELIVSADIWYEGDCSFKAETTANIKFGSHFPSKTVPLALVIRLTHVSGKVRLLIKPPPSNRVWYAFYEKPRLHLIVEPMVARKQLTNNYLINFITQKLVELVHETIVMPNMNDLAFFIDNEAPIKGGLWDIELFRAPTIQKPAEKDAKAERKKSGLSSSTSEESLNRHISKRSSNSNDTAPSSHIIADKNLEPTSNIQLKKNPDGNLVETSELSDSDENSVLSNKSSTLSKKVVENTSPLKYTHSASKSFIGEVQDSLQALKTKAHKPRSIGGDSSQTTLSETTKKYGSVAKKSFFQGVSDAKSFVKKIKSTYIDDSSSNSPSDIESNYSADDNEISKSKAQNAIDFNVTNTHSPSRSISSEKSYKAAERGQQDKHNDVLVDLNPNVEAEKSNPHSNSQKTSKNDMSRNQRNKYAKEIMTGQPTLHPQGQLPIQNVEQRATHKPLPRPPVQVETREPVRPVPPIPKL